MSKIFASPGVSSRPLNFIEWLREFWRTQPKSTRRFLRYVWRQNRQQRKEIQRLAEALSIPPVSSGKPLKVESLEATMLNVTFDASQIRST